MSINRNSESCGTGISKLDRYIKENYMSYIHPMRLAVIRGMAINDENLFSNTFKEKYTSTGNSSVLDVYDNLALKLAKNPNTQLTESDNDFIVDYANEITRIIKTFKDDDRLSKYLISTGISDASTIQQYKNFKNTIPAMYRREVTTQLVSYFMDVLDWFETNPKSPYYGRGMSRTEIIDSVGVDKLFARAKKAIDITYRNNEDKLSESQKNVMNTLLTNKEAWAAAKFMTKNTLLEAEHIKIGNKLVYVEYVYYNDLDILEAFDSDMEVASAEEEGPEHWMLKSNTISSFSSMTKEVRSLLYKIRESNERTGILGQPSIVDVMKLHESLQRLRHENFCQNSEEFLSVLQNSDNSSYQQLYSLLINGKPELRTQFFNVYKTNELNYSYNTKKVFKKGEDVIGFQFFRERSGKKDDLIMSSYTASAVSGVSENCLFNNNGRLDYSKCQQFILNVFGYNNSNNPNPEIPYITVDSNGVSIINTDVIFREPNDNITSRESYETWKNNPKNAQKRVERKREFINYISDSFNIKLNERDVNILMSNNYAFEKFSTAVIDLMPSLYFRVGDKKYFSSLLDGVNSKAAIRKLVLSSKKSLTLLEKVSAIESKFRYNKSSYSIHTVPCFLGDTLERLGRAATEGADSLRSYIKEAYLNCPIYADKLEDGTYNIKNYWLKTLYNTTDEDLENPNSFVNEFINGLIRGLGTKEKEFEKFTEKDNIIYSLNEFLTNWIQSDHTLGATPLFVTGDSNSSRMLKTPVLSVDEILDEMVTVALQEVDRQQMFSDFIEFARQNNLRLSNGHKGSTVDELEKLGGYTHPIIENANKFTLIRCLNDKENYSKFISAKEKYDSVKDSDQKEAALEEYKNTIRTIISDDLREGYNKFIAEAQRNNVLLKGTIGLRVALNPKELCVEGVTTNEDIHSRMIQAFYYNTKFHMMQQFQMFTVDPGFYNGTEDFQKRYKEMIASGNAIDLTALDPSDSNKLICPSGKQNVIYFNEEVRDCITDPKFQKFKDMIMSLPSDRYSRAQKEAIIKKYGKNTLTDGQSYRTFTSYRSIMVMRGKWTSDMESIYQKIMAVRKEGRRLTKDELSEIEDKNVTFQPIKPFYFGFEKISINGKEITIPVQHKYSEYVIIPELLPENNRLGNLGMALEEAKIDLACCTTCVKVGGFGSTSISNCTSKEDFDALFVSNDSSNPNVLGNEDNTCYKHSLDLNGWREQSNIPEHINSSRARGTQVIKHGLACLNNSNSTKTYKFMEKLGNRIKISKNKNEDIIIENGSMSNANLVSLYSALCGYGFIKSTLEKVHKLSTPKGISELLTSLRLNDTRSSSDGIEAYTIDPSSGEIIMSPCEGINAVDNMAALLSTVRKDVVKQMFKGGSAVQVSAYGFDEDLEIHFDESGNPTIADCAMAFDFDYSDPSGNRYKLEYTDFVDPNTGFLLDEDGNAVEEAIDDISKTKLGKLFPGIADLIAYRIPTERAYSMLNLRVKKFFPKTAGGIIMVPAQFTTIAGFDFDIDKLYFLRKEFVLRPLKDIVNKDNPEEVYDIWTDYYKHNAFGRLIYRVATEELGLMGTKEDPIRAHWDEIYNTIENSSRIKQWPEFLDVDIRDFPKTDKEAFTDYVKTSILPNHNNDYSFDNVEFISNYDSSKPMLSNNQASVNNLIFDFLRERLMDRDTLEERITPGGYATLKEAKPVMMCIRYGNSDAFKKILNSENPYDALLEYSNTNFKDFSPNYDPTEISTIAHYQTANAIYDTLIGVAANQNINQRMTSLTEELYLEKPILFGEASPTEDTNGDKRNQGLGKDIKTRFIAGRDTELLSTEFLASAVDSVKDALLEYFGIDLSNFNSVCLLAKLGYGAHDIGLLFNQPVVIRTIERLKESSSKASFIEALYGTVREEYINGEDSIKEYNKLLAELSKENNGISNYSLITDRNSLVRYIAQDKLALTEGKTRDFIRGQLGVIRLLSNLQSAASEFAEVINMTKSSSVKSTPSDLGSIQDIEQTALAAADIFGHPEVGSLFKMVLATRDSRIDTVLNPYLRISDYNADSVLGMISKTPFGLEQAAYSAIFTIIDDIISAYFPFRTKAYRNITNCLAGLTTKKLLSSDIFNALNRDYMVYCIERMTSIFSDDTPVVLTYPGENYAPKKMQLTILKRDFYSNSSEINFPAYFDEVVNKNQTRIKELLKEGKNPLELGILDYSKIPIIAGVISQRFGKKKTLSFKGLGSLVKYQKDAIIDSFEFVLGLAEKHNDPVLEDLGRHLFLYSFFNHGFNFSEGSVMSLVPFAFKMALGSKEALNNLDERELYSVFFNRLFNLDTEIDDSGNAVIIERDAGIGSRFSLKHLLQAFILNHPEFWQFTKEVKYSSSENSLYSNLSNLIYEGKGESRTIKNSFTIDLTTNDSRNSSLSSLATVKFDREGNIESSVFTPAIVINGITYMCDSDELISDEGTLVGNSIAFNVSHPNRVGMMTYYRMNPTTGSVDYSTPRLYNVFSVGNLQKDREDIQGMIETLYQEREAITDDTQNNNENGTNPQVITEKNPLLWTLSSALSHISYTARSSDLYNGSKENLEAYLENIRELRNSIMIYANNTKLTFNPENIESEEDPNGTYSIEGAKAELAKLEGLLKQYSGNKYSEDSYNTTLKNYIDKAYEALDRIDAIVSDNTVEVAISSKNEQMIEITKQQNLCE